MNWVIDLLKSIFVRAPREIILALLRMIMLLLLLILVLLLWLWALLLKAWKKGPFFTEDTDDPCGRLPEAVARRPDPAIYSQELLMSQGISVTWNNPDIWMAKASDPTNTEPDSYHLEDDTVYVVTVQVHNASTDAAMGVRVRLRYRQWSFNTPNFVPVQNDPGGSEVANYVNIPPMGSETTTFLWHTPALEPGEQKRHYCIQASLFHPLDVNTANNVGQENTNVWSTPNPGPAKAGDVVEVEVPLANATERPAAFVIAADSYEIVDETVELRLKTTHAAPRLTPVQKVADLLPQYYPGRHATTTHRAPVDTGSAGEHRSKPIVHDSGPRYSWRVYPKVVGAKNRYTGLEALRDRVAAQDVRLDPDMVVTVDGNPLGEPLDLGPGETHVSTVAIKVPDNAPSGGRYPVNIVAATPEGVLAGGVTIIIPID